MLQDATGSKRRAGRNNALRRPAGRDAVRSSVKGSCQELSRGFFRTAVGLKGFLKGACLQRVTHAAYGQWVDEIAERIARAAVAYGNQHPIFGEAMKRTP